MGRALPGFGLAPHGAIVGVVIVSGVLCIVRANDAFVKGDLSDLAVFPPLLILIELIEHFMYQVLKYTAFNF